MCLTILVSLQGRNLENILHHLCPNNVHKAKNVPGKCKDSIFRPSSDLESVLQEIELAKVLFDRRNSGKILSRADASVRPQRPDLAQLLAERVGILLIVSLQSKGGFSCKMKLIHWCPVIRIMEHPKVYFVIRDMRLGSLNPVRYYGFLGITSDNEIVL